jgi:hypothetical protein
MKKIPCNELGYRIGEGHHNCTRTDALVKRARDLHEGIEDWPTGERLGPVRIAEILGVPLRWVHKVIYFEIRAQVPREWRSNSTVRSREENEAMGRDLTP